MSNESRRTVRLHRDPGRARQPSEHQQADGEQSRMERQGRCRPARLRARAAQTS